MRSVGRIDPDRDARIESVACEIIPLDPIGGQASGIDLTSDTHHSERCSAQSLHALRLTLRFQVKGGTLYGVYQRDAEGGERSRRTVQHRSLRQRLVSIRPARFYRAMNTGKSLCSSMSRVAPPNTASRKRE